MNTGTHFPGIVKAEARQRACRRAVREIATQANSDLWDVDLALTAINCRAEFEILFEGQDEARRRETLKAILERGLEIAFSDKL
jgi:hypothetical protein